MIIPEKINHLQFYNQLKKEKSKIKITSRFKGVFFSASPNPGWVAQFHPKRGGTVYGGKFPFTALGEKSAYAAYLRLVEEFGKNPKG